MYSIKELKLVTTQILYSSIGATSEAKKKEEEELMFLKQRNSENRKISRFYQVLCHKRFVLYIVITGC